MSRFVVLCAFYAFSTPVFADGHSSMTKTADNTLSAAPTQWLGDTPHFVLFGTVEGQSFEIEFLDTTTASDVSRYRAKRTFRETDDDYRYTEIDMKFEAQIAGIEREFELELENRDFGSFNLPASFSLVGQGRPEGANASLEFEFEWKDGRTSVDEDVSNWSGTLDLAADSSSANSSDIEGAGEGTVSGFINATKGDDTLVVSFTVPVGGYEIDD